MKRIYLDNAATTPLGPKIAQLMHDFELEFFGNPNSIHKEGQQARAQIDTARESIADFFGAKPQEIIFTSSATESNNLAIKGIVSHYINEFGRKPHVVTTTLEHQSVYNVVKQMEKRGVIEATYVKPNKQGRIRAEDVIKEIQDNTILISAIFVSNEIGSVLPIREIARQLEDVNKTQKHQIYFHTDAVQAVKFYNCKPEKLSVDLLTFSAHKINGPKGIGGLFVKNRTKLDPLMFGGSQEYDLRPGTQNSPGIIGMAKAIENLSSLEQRQKSGTAILKLKSLILTSLLKKKNIELNGTSDPELSCPDIINFSVLNEDQDTLMAKLDMAGFAVSTGSACVSGSTEPSHVIKSLGKGTKTGATVRVSIGKQNTIAEIKKFIEFFK